jgi:hypothetical protein
MVIGYVAWLELHHMIYMRLSENLNGDLVFLVACSRKRFTEVEAEQWWAENRVRVYERYNVKITTNSTTSSDSSAVTDSSVLSSYMPVTY